MLHLRDTAGIRRSDDVVESIGIEKAYAALDDAALVLAVFDGSSDLGEFDSDLIEKCRGKNAVAVINKTDLPQKADLETIKNSFDNIVSISAKNQVGLDELADTVTKILGVADFDSSAPMLANARQKTKLPKRSGQSD